jgi:hypothetical protein
LLVGEGRTTIGVAIVVGCPDGTGVELVIGRGVRVERKMVFVSLG